MKQTNKQKFEKMKFILKKNFSYCKQLHGKELVQKAAMFVSANILHPRKQGDVSSSRPKSAVLLDFY